MEHHGKYFASHYNYYIPVYNTTVISCAKMSR